VVRGRRSEGGVCDLAYREGERKRREELLFLTTEAKAPLNGRRGREKGFD